MKKGWVYILKCSDESYYTGTTSNIEQRIVEHKEGKMESSYTALRQPVELVFQQEFSDIRDAIAFERQVKGWSRKKKEALINGDFEKLIELSKNTLRQAQCDRTSHPEPVEG
jgi:putative endonuclease